MGRYSGKTCRLLTMLLLTGSFFVVEIIVGYVTNSIALVADSFHMLSDVIALIVGFASIRISKWPSRNNTYGWVRAEVLGALINSVFLLALCFSILVESLKRLVQVEEIENPVLLLAVGGSGLLVNIIGLVIFHGDVHGHSHGGHSHEEVPQAENQEETQELVLTSPEVVNGKAVVIEMEKVPIGQSKKKSATSSQLNMKGVFLHVLGDALGSVVVIISSLVIWLSKGEWRFYVDPAMSIAMVILILGTSIPLLRQTSQILLQTAPDHISHDKLKKKLEEMDGVHGVHEFHLWQLTTNRLILSAHITCDNMQEYMTIASRAKEIFHDEGVHSTTIQPEFDTMLPMDSKECKLICANDDCIKDTCCGNGPPSTRNKVKKRGEAGDSSSSVQQATPPPHPNNEVNSNSIPNSVPDASADGPLNV